MPLYEYQCANDGTFEQMRKFSDPPLTICPKCGGPIEKLLSAPAIQFKGTGWYVTDYARKSGGGEPAKGKGGAEKAAAATDGGASDSKSGKPGPTPAGGGTSGSGAKK